MASVRGLSEVALGGGQSRQWGWSTDQEAGPSSSWTLKTFQESGRWEHVEAIYYSAEIHVILKTDKHAFNEII